MDTQNNEMNDMSTNYIFTPASNLVLYHYEDIAGSKYGNSGITPVIFTIFGSNPLTFSPVAKFGSYSINMTTGNQEAASHDFINFDFQKRFTVDFWWLVTTLVSTSMIYPILLVGVDSTPDTAYLGISMQYDSVFTSVGLYVRYHCNSSNYATPSWPNEPRFSLGIWHHIAVVRDSDTNISVYIDGAKVTYITIPAISKIVASVVPDDNGIVTANTMADFSGNIKMDELAIAPIAKWTSNFTPPVAAYTH